MIRRRRDRRRRRRRVRVELDPRAIGERIRATRHRLDVRLVDLASVTGLSAYRVWQLDSGRELPTLGEAVVISAALYRSLEWILLGAPRRALLWKFLELQPYDRRTGKEAGVGDRVSFPASDRRAGRKKRPDAGSVPDECGM